MRRLLPLLLLAAATPLTMAQGTAPAGSAAQAAPVLDSSDPNRVVATVNGEEIRAAEYYRRLEWFRPEPQSALVTTPAGFQVLRQMISERMINQLAKSKGLAPTAPEIDARVAEVYKENPGLKAQLVESGRNEIDLRADLLNKESQFKLMTDGVTITDLEVEKHYKENPSEFRQPARYKLRIVAVGDDASQTKVDDALKAGRAFPDVAKEFSLDITTKNRGGDYGEVPESALSESTRKAIEITPVGSTTAWIRGPKSDKGEQSDARVKFFVEGVTPAVMTPLDPTMKARLRRRLMLDRGTVKNKTSVGKELEAATQAAKVVIVQPQFQSLYTQLLDRVRKAQG